MTYGCDKGLGRIRPKLTLPLPQLRPSLTRFKGSATQGQPNSPVTRRVFLKSTRLSIHDRHRPQRGFDPKGQIGHLGQ